ncbi:glycoside hydrolase family 113 [Adhaeretor mobilis]|uniref:Uncharacterized protein n=1 Tax=Adhaeretor mobilis TaxID=1930276 RepID=A0A517MWE2_9BACT|nr:dockerin type I domain-containing protein [Adhaeretor mobilis]QDS99189.1 hypothetical protein HG15A2_24810 [Adhaeretor mobilis]
MSPNCHRLSISRLLLALCTLHLGQLASAGDPAVYEPGVDPGVGFNLVSWGNFGNGTQVWENAVQSAYDAGFDEVSLSPIRFYTPGSGSIATTSSSGPELSHVAAGVVRAKSLGMRVTVNPFVEPVGFSGWRGLYNPTPGSAESNTFWNDYQQYITDVATMAQTNGADSLTVGTELRGLTRNSGNNANWTSVINSANTAFSGSIGYAANWDNYHHPNVASTIWDHSAIDYVGIDSYFTNLLTNSQADASGSYPDAGFISTVESAWNNKLDNEILPFASSLQSGSGLPVEFTEVGYLPRNRTTVNPQNGSGALNQDEQNMAFEGLMRALDGRLASGEFLATHIWQWDMQGSGGSSWNMNPNGGNQPTNQQTAQWLSDFVGGTLTDHGDPPDHATQVLYSFENGVDGFYYPNFETQPASTLLQATSTGATHESHSLAITKPTAPWTWDARVEMGGEQLQTLQDALNDDIDKYVLEMDVTYVASDLPVGLADLNLHVSLETDLDDWNQAFPYADIDSPVDQLFEVEIPLSDFNLSAGIAWANLHLGFAGVFSGDATFYIDRIALTDTTFVAEDADFNEDGEVDGEDFLLWQRGSGTESGAALAQGDANGDGTVDALDLAVWQSQYGQASSSVSSLLSVPEPTSYWLLFCACSVLCRVRKSS